MESKKISREILKKGYDVKVDIPLSIYITLFLEKETGKQVLAQHLLNTNYLKENVNSKREFPNITDQIENIFTTIEISDEAKKLVEEWENA